MSVPVLLPGEPEPVELIRGQRASRLLIHADHGGNTVPRNLNHLGIGADTLSRHVGWDIGAAAVSRHLAMRMDATAVIARYSRLIIDVNRALGDPEAIPQTSDGFAIPANVNMTAEQQADRVRTLYWPYHQSIDWELGLIREAGHLPAVLSVHSFTPALMSRDRVKPRPWHCGVMFSRDTRFGDHLIAEMRKVPGMIVGENEPYSGITHGYCAKVHGLSQSVPHAQIEIRQDLICTEAGQRWWADYLATIIPVILNKDDMNELRHY
ncbi:MAG: N-formylglutamate amidohydrolase [Rhodospirillaceae bacterium]|nr:N-formylglutamate amidohydrolase [Rhodospirillaceae bacterium]